MAKIKDMPNLHKTAAVDMFTKANTAKVPGF